MLIQEMTEAECATILARTRLGRLACAHQNQPYIVPIYFAYEQPYLYAFTTPGQKIEWMRYNPLVCVEVDEVEDNEHWTSVVISGRYEELQRMPDWKDPSLHSLDLLNQRAGWWVSGCASAAHRDQKQPLNPIFPSPDSPGQAGEPSRTQGRLHRLLQALSRLAGRDRSRGTR
jgi:nitroimidazol reductase NimA-like FMN-containing flavoprotein (pyridoxamine 5'-phosphate oxidase superfamily)